MLKTPYVAVFAKKNSSGLPDSNPEGVGGADMGPRAIVRSIVCPSQVCCIRS